LEGTRKASKKRVLFLLYDNVGPTESVVSPCEVCAKPAELGLNENSCENDDSCGLRTVFASFFEFTDASHRVHTAEDVNYHAV